MSACPVHVRTGQLVRTCWATTLVNVLMGLLAATARLVWSLFGLEIGCSRLTASPLGLFKKYKSQIALLFCYQNSNLSKNQIGCLIPSVL